VSVECLSPALTAIADFTAKYHREMSVLVTRSEKALHPSIALRTPNTACTADTTRLMTHSFQNKSNDYILQALGVNRPLEDSTKFYKGKKKISSASLLSCVFMLVPLLAFSTLMPIRETAELASE